MYNKAVLVGNMGKDPEVKTLPNGTTVANFSLATNESFKKDGKYEKKTTWHNIKVFGGTADFVAKYLKSGSKVLVEGKITSEQWQDKADPSKTHYKTVIIASQIQSLSRMEKTTEDQNDPSDKLFPEDYE